MLKRPQKLMMGSLFEYLLWEAQESARLARKDFTLEEKKELRSQLKEIRPLLAKIQGA